MADWLTPHLDRVLIDGVAQGDGIVNVNLVGYTATLSSDGRTLSINAPNVLPLVAGPLDGGVDVIHARGTTNDHDVAGLAWDGHNNTWIFGNTGTTGPTRGPTKIYAFTGPGVGYIVNGSTGDIEVTGGLTLSGRSKLTPSAVTITAGPPDTWTVDWSAASTQTIALVDGHDATIAAASIADGTLCSLTVQRGETGGGDVTFSSDYKFRGGYAATVDVGGGAWSTFWFLAAAGELRCVGRSGSTPRAGTVTLDGGTGAATVSGVTLTANSRVSVWAVDLAGSGVSAIYIADPSSRDVGAGTFGIQAYDNSGAAIAQADGVEWAIFEP